MKRFVAAMIVGAVVVILLMGDGLTISINLTSEKIARSVGSLTIGAAVVAAIVYPAVKDWFGGNK